MERLISKPVQGYHITVAEVGSEKDTCSEDGARHFLGGKLKLIGGVCPVCRGDLTRLITLDLADGRLECEAIVSTELPIIFCHKCSYWVSTYYYCVLSADQVRVLDYSYDVEPDWDTPFGPIELPEKTVKLSPISSELQQVIVAFNEGEISSSTLPSSLRYKTDLFHQVGGEPILIQNNSNIILNCPECKMTMPFLVTIGNADDGSGGIFGYEYAQLLAFVCQACSIVAAMIQVD